MMLQLQQIIHGVHFPTILTAFVAYMLGSFAVYYNGTPVDISTNQGRESLVMLLLTAVVVFLQKATPKPTV